MGKPTLMVVGSMVQTFCCSFACINGYIAFYVWEDCREARMALQNYVKETKEILDGLIPKEPDYMAPKEPSSPPQEEAVEEQELDIEGVADSATDVDHGCLPLFQCCEQPSEKLAYSSCHHYGACEKCMARYWSAKRCYVCPLPGCGRKSKRRPRLASKDAEVD